MNPIGIIVIGRNEGNRLKECLLSVIGELRTVIYVDSGSTDNSVSEAKSLGIHVVELDLSVKFTAARARNAGFEYLLLIKPEIEFVQFVDGDCRVVSGWLERAASELMQNTELVVVCGRRREEFPNNSIFNRLLDIEWNTPVGEALACGGDAMMRVSALKKVGGFNSKLIAGEEPELCLRLRTAGGKILRIDADMTLHDAQMTRLSQWWKRSVRSGYGFLEGALLYGLWVRQCFRIWFWSLFLPLLAIAGLFLIGGLSVLLLLVAYTFLSYRVYQIARGKGFNSMDSFFYGVFCLLEKYPQLLGQSQYFIFRFLNKQTNIVEYKHVG
ncbi:family 2 glycosyl transferase [Calothrix sp. NIES-4071]|nr:family 2 glycosyl transferase [Calothrix sp. NIES-4071]BAZ54544.1 family 2 glycosyl transferase [Calothrix sp. NIES-4105]